MSADGNLYANRITKNINNNEKIFYSEIEKNIPKESKKNEKNIYQKINEIFSSRNYVYKAKVLISTKNGEKNKTIIGRNSNYLITNENELILISDIIDIKLQ